MFIKGALCNVKYAGCRVGVMFNCSCSCASASVCPVMCICKTRPQCKKCWPVYHQTLLVLIVFLSLSVGSGLFWSSLLQKYWPTLIIKIPFKIVHFGTTVEKVLQTSISFPPGDTQPQLTVSHNNQTTPTTIIWCRTQIFLLQNTEDMLILAKTDISFKKGPRPLDPSARGVQIRPWRVWIL